MEIGTLTQEKLREILDYDATTGVFTRKVARGHAPAGVRVGSADKDGYLIVSIDYRAYKLHRLAWLYVNGKWPNGVIDHVNGVKSDNRLDNLRDCTRSTNSQNQRRPRVSNKLGILGVSRSKGGFTAQIHAKGRKQMLGVFKTAEAAQAAYLASKRALHAGCTI